jgi:hypothetical protein
MPQSSSDLAPRAKVAALVFVLSCLLSSARIIIDTPPARRLNNHEISQRSDERFAELKSLLPQRGVVGYVGESGDPESEDPGIADYYLAQYALAPLVIERSPNHHLVVGNFPRSLPSQAPSDHLRVVKNFGDGLLLYENREGQ